MAGAADDGDLPSLAPQWLKEGGALGAGSAASRIVKSSPAAEEATPAARQGGERHNCFRSPLRSVFQTHCALHDPQNLVLAAIFCLCPLRLKLASLACKFATAVAREHALIGAYS